MVLKWLVPLAVPLLLLDADLRKCFKSMSSLFKAFLVGSFGSFVGSMIAFKLGLIFYTHLFDIIRINSIIIHFLYSLVPMSSILDSYKVASAICARHIGGAVNFIAISEILEIKSDIVTATIAADNVVVALYFTLLFALSAPERSTPSPNKSAIGSVQEQTLRYEEKDSKQQLSLVSMEKAKCPIPMFNTEGGEREQGEALAAYKGAEQSNEQPENGNQYSTSSTGLPIQKDITIEKLLGATSLSFSICAVSQLLNHITGAPSILLSSILAVMSATLFPAKIAPIAHAGGVLGVIFMQMFFAVTGVSIIYPTQLLICILICIMTILSIHFIGYGTHTNSH